MPNHTPGPWTIHTQSVRGVEHVSVIAGPDPRTAQAPAFINTVCPDHEANAHLIAAAPDMLAALLEVEWLLERYSVSGAEHAGTRTLALIRAAIAKAEGRQP